jgi:glycosyltransferase involved in cell wall biosynthesis
MLYQLKNDIDMRNNYTFKMPNRNRSYPKKLPVSSLQARIPQLVMITTFPPRECGIATYAQDLMKALNDKFVQSFDTKICALENEKHQYGSEVKYVLETTNQESYVRFTEQMNNSEDVSLIVLQHEFGLFREHEKGLLEMLCNLKQPVIIVFHTVLPKPEEATQLYIQKIVKKVSGIIVMTNNAVEILVNDYLIPKHKITMIPHGTHLVRHSDNGDLKQKYGYQGRKVLSTFGLLSSGKSIETSLYALPAICKKNPETLFLIIGKTHPTVAKTDGEEYRNCLLSIIRDLNLEAHVSFVNEYLPLKSLLEYLQLTDIYLFTSKDPNQAVSGTFSYALSCGCPIISTPIPHAREVLQNGVGRIIDFENSAQLSREVNKLLNNKKLRLSISLNGLQEMAPTAWENSALRHAQLFQTISDDMQLSYKIPEVNLNHLQKMTTDFGIIQFSVINQPDLNYGYTLDDNARALIGMCQHYKMFSDKTDLNAIECYLDFIVYCFQPDGFFVNYISAEGKLTPENKSCNLEDSSGRAIWALGYLLSLYKIMPNGLIVKAETVFDKAILNVASMHSTRAMAFCIKGIHYANIKKGSKQNIQLLDQFANRMARMYEHEADKNWQWYESYLTYANSALPEAMLFAFLATGKTNYQSISLLTFDFLLGKIFTHDYLQVISNKGWLHNGQELNFENKGGEQPIDVAYTIMALSEFYETFKIEDYKNKMQLAFDWFLGKNHLNQIVYNPCTGGCYDGLETTHINLNQGAESTISYLLARLTIEPYQADKSKSIKITPAKLTHNKIVSTFKL